MTMDKDELFKCLDALVHSGVRHPRITFQALEHETPIQDWLKEYNNTPLQEWLEEYNNTRLFLSPFMLDINFINEYTTVYNYIIEFPYQVTKTAIDKVKRKRADVVLHMYEKSLAKRDGDHALGKRIQSFLWSGYTDFVSRVS